jgi:dipeptidyl aminopeptidase/acylaminoacyl peptidase
MGKASLLLLAASLLWAGDPAKQPITASDLLKIRRITEVQIAPGGAFAVYGLQSIHTAKDDKGEPDYTYRTHLWRVDFNDSQPRQLTFGDRKDTALSLSPDGRTLAFVRESAAGKDKPKPQIWLLSLAVPGEARQLTHFEHGATAPAWHPSGKSLLVSSPVPISRIEGKPHYAMERPARDWSDWDRAKPVTTPDGDIRAVRNWLEHNAGRSNPTILHRLAFQDEQGLKSEPTVSQLFSVDVEHGRASALTRDFYSHAGYSYSPDGSQIVSISSPQSKEHPDRLRRNAVWLRNADGSEPRPVLDEESENPTAVLWYPDSRSLLVTTQGFDEPTFRQFRLARLELASLRLTTVTEGWDSSVTAAAIASDRAILFTSNHEGAAPLKRTQAGRISDVVSGPVGVSDFDESEGRIVYAQISVANPNELYLREPGGAVRQLTSHNASWLAARHVSLPTEKWIRRPDGTLVQSWVMNPLHPQPGRRYPFVLDIHGGPHAMWGPGEFSMWYEFQLLCAWGYGVVYSNPRGSSGYGYAFQKANYRDWGAGPAGDVLAALDDAVASNPFVDAKRLYLTGGSYAGYLTAWIIAHDHRFVAAAAQRGVYDLTTFYGEGNAFWLVKNSFGGRPYEPEVRKLLEAQSPFTHVVQMRTPLLILHGSQDLRTGVSQSEMLYRALKDLGRPVEYVRYPAIGHELTRSGPPLQRMDHMMRIIEFFQRYESR